MSQTTATNLTKSAPLALLIALVMAGAGAAPNGAPLGQALSGESCVLSAGQDIICGANSEPDGTLRLAPLPELRANDLSARRAALLRTAKTLRGGVNTPNDITCDGGQWLSAQGSESILFFCTTLGTNW